jgi:antitoxin component YwqK of YwqJK toxin-antitoxin module
MRRKRNRYLVLMFALTFVGFGLLGCESHPENGTETITYISGEPWKIFRYKNGALNGIAVELSRGGGVLAEMMYENGKQHGLTTIYYMNGKPEKEINYAYGKKDGKAITYWPEGFIMLEEEFSGGKLISSTQYKLRDRKKK